MQEFLAKFELFWDQSESIAELSMLVILFGTAIAAWRSAVSSREATDKTRVTADAQLMVSLLDHYGSDEMSDAMPVLRQFEQDHGPETLARYRELREESPKAFRRLNRYRRHVQKFFIKVYRLQAADYIDDDFVRRVVTPGRAEFFIEVLEPIEEGHNPDYDRRAFEYFAKLHKQVSYWGE